MRSLGNVCFSRACLAFAFRTVSSLVLSFVSGDVCTSVSLSVNIAEARLLLLLCAGP